MPMNDYSIGRDVTLDLITQDGPLRFAKLTGFMSRQETNDQKVKGMDGEITNLYIPDGWTGTFDYERKDSKLEDFFCKFEADYYNGRNLQGATVTETIKEPNGSVSQYRYQGVMFKLDDSGDIKGDTTIKQKISFVASRRIKVG